MNRKEFIIAYNIGFRDGKIEDYAPTDYPDFISKPCEDCISRQAVLDAFWKLDIELRPNAIDAILNMVNDMPPVTPAPKMGKWVTHPAVINSHIFCNLCLTAAPMDKPTKYCPGCGVLMTEIDDADKED